MKETNIRRTCGSVRSSLSAPARGVTFGSEAAVTTTLHLRMKKTPRGGFPDCQRQSGLRARLDERGKEIGIPDIADKIADETTAQTAEELVEFLTKVGHPALSMPDMGTLWAAGAEPSAPAPALVPVATPTPPTQPTTAPAPIPETRAPKPEPRDPNPDYRESSPSPHSVPSCAPFPRLLVKPRLNGRSCSRPPRRRSSN